LLGHSRFLIKYKIKTPLQKTIPALHVCRLQCDIITVLNAAITKNIINTIIINNNTLILTCNNLKLFMYDGCFGTKLRKRNADQLPKYIIITVLYGITVFRVALLWLHRLGRSQFTVKYVPPPDITNSVRLPAPRSPAIFSN